jgi:hypothetical protein
MSYRPNSHYWIIADSTTDVYFSGTNTMVPPNDPDYTAWLGDVARGPNKATDIASIDDLRAVLTPIGVFPAWLMAAQPSFIQPAVGVYTQGQLTQYAASVRNDTVLKGIVVNPGNITFMSDAYTMANLNAAYIYTQANPGQTFQWKLADGSFVTLNAAQVGEVQGFITDWTAICYSCEDSTLTSIEGGTVTTLPQIDAAFAALQNVYTLTAVGDLKLRHRRPA